MHTTKNKVLIHPDLVIELSKDEKGADMYKGTSTRYEPYEATAQTAIDCFFQFNIQLSEQKVISALLNK